MKRALILSLAAILAFPLLADETKKAEEKKKTETKAATAAPAPAATPDSPMVQAAKRANRLGRKSTTTVITNESLKSSKGHMTTTATQHPVNNVPAPELGPEAKAAAANAARAAEEKRVREIGEKQKAAAAEAEKKAGESAVAAEEEENDAENIDYAAGQRPPLR